MIALECTQSDPGAIKGLCLEFILHELAKAFTLSNQLTNASTDEKVSILDQFIHIPSPFEMVQPGIIDKLCFYCEALIQNSKMGDCLLDAIDELRSIISLSRSTLSRQQRMVPFPHTPSNEWLNALDQSLRSFFYQLVPVFKACLDSETALFALLELRKTLNRFLGDHTVEEILQQLFPEGPHQLRQMLLDKFSQRGFHFFCHNHEKLLEGLAWSNQELCVVKPSA